MTSGPVNFSHICLTDKQLMVHGTDLEYNLQRYIYPAIATFGIMGNALNLTVLLNRNMRSRANSFLAVLAFADIIFLSLVLPNVLANYGIIFNSHFRWIYFTTKVHLISMANWSSAVAIWCIISVCADRLWGIRNPLYARDAWPRWKMPVIILSIVGLTGFFTFYQHFEYVCPLRAFCNGTQLFSRCHTITEDSIFGRPNPYSQEWRSLISFCVMLYPLLMIIFPIILLAILNMMLICALRRRQRNLLMGGHCSEPRRSTEASNFSKTEHRVTLTVTFIVTMFTITNGPSALEHIVRKAYNLKQQEYYDITMISSTLVIFGKASNFILFCLGSKHFRLRLIKLTQKKVNKKIAVHCTTLGVNFWRGEQQQQQHHSHSHSTPQRTPPTTTTTTSTNQQNFSTTFLDRPSFRRNSLPSVAKYSTHTNDTNNNTSDIEKKRSQSKPSLGVRNAPNAEQLRLLNGRSNSTAPLARMERFTNYDHSSELHQPLIHHNSNGITD